MYLGFYGLTEKPFNMTPDPRFLYLTPGHREALAQLTYAIREGQGFVALTGDVGTGKTTILRALLEQLDETTAVAHVVNSTLSFEGILEYVLEDFGVSSAGATRAQRLVALNNFLIDRHRVGQKSVIVIDEAQHLDAGTLEQLRLLSNFQTTRETLLQILLAGQPALRARLDLPELRQLKQWIALRCTIRPLTPDEVRAYLRFRLRVAGSQDLDLFTDQAIARIAAYAGGIPRIVNTLADHCLLIGYADQRRRLDRDTVDEAIAYREDGTPPAPRRRAGSRVRARQVLRWAARGPSARWRRGRPQCRARRERGRAGDRLGRRDAGGRGRGIGAALVETARSVGHGARMGARGIAAPGALLWAGAIAVGASVTAAGHAVGRGVRRGVRRVPSAGAMLWVGVRGVGAAVTAAGRNVGHGVSAGARGIASVGAMLGAAGRGIGAALVETARSVGHGARMGARGIAARGALLWAGAIAVGASVTAAGHAVGRGVRSGARLATLMGAQSGAAARSVGTGLAMTGRPVRYGVRTGVRGLVSAGAMLRALAWRVAASVALARYAASRCTEAWVTHQVASISPKLRGWSPGAAVAVLGLVVVTLVLALWPLSYEPPPLERPLPSDARESLKPPLERPPPSDARESLGRPPVAERKPSARAVARGGPRPRETSGAPASVAREPVTFATPPPSDR